MRALVLSAALGVLACAAASAQQPVKVRASNGVRVGPVTDAAPTRLPKIFQFDDGVRLSQGLGFAIDRPVATVDDEGAPVGVDQARFARPMTIASAVDATVVRASNYGTTILGSGLDHDGVTPLLVVRDSTLNAIDVFSVAGDGMAMAEATGVGRVRTSLGPSNAVDLMAGTITNRRYDPRAGVVCHGLIVLVCSVARQPFPPISAWTICSTALITSQDRGQTWQLLYEDVIVQENRERVREWSMQNWWPQEMGVSPTTAYFVAADYRSKPGCDGGRVLGFRATRAAPGSAWSLDAPALVYQTPTVAAGQHAHTAAIFPHADGLRAIVAIGDTQTFNRIVAVDRAGTQITPGGWSAIETYHGSEGTSGNQFVGCAPGSTLGHLIVGADLCHDQIMGLDATGPTARHSWLYGCGWASGLSNQNFVIRTPTPEHGGPYCATYEPQQNSTTFPPGARRVLYSEDGEHWAPLFAPMTESTWAAAVHGGHVYIDGDGVSKLGLRRVARPAYMRTAKALLVGGGGMQRLAPAPTMTPGTGGTVTALTKNGDGLWVDGGVPIQPQPPCVGPVWKLTGTLGSADSRIADIIPISTSDMGQVVGSSRIIGRLWLMNLMDKSMTPRFELKPSGGAVIETRNVNVTSRDAWAPVDFVVSVAIPTGQRPVVRVRSAVGGSDVQAFYLAMDGWAEGEGFPGYSMGPDTSTRLDGTAYPDERAEITGLTPGPSWTVTLAGMTPMDGWDASVLSKAGLHWPLASVCVGEGTGAERLVFLGDVENHQLRAELWRGGAVVGTWRLTETVWVRQSPVLISVACAGPGQDLAITVAACGMGAREMMRTTAGSAPITFVGAPDRIRFDDGTGIDGAGVEVHTSTMAWYGGEVLEDAALGATARADRLRSLSFLRPEALRRTAR